MGGAQAAGSLRPLIPTSGSAQELLPRVVALWVDSEFRAVLALLVPTVLDSLWGTGP